MKELRKKISNSESNEKIFKRVWHDTRGLYLYQRNVRTKMYESSDSVPRINGTVTNDGDSAGLAWELGQSENSYSSINARKRRLEDWKTRWLVWIVAELLCQREHTPVCNLVWFTSARLPVCRRDSRSFHARVIIDDDVNPCCCCVEAAGFTLDLVIA